MSEVFFCAVCDNYLDADERIKKLEQQNAKLKSALAFYAALKYVSDDMPVIDGKCEKFGHCAREALKECDND